MSDGVLIAGGGLAAQRCAESLRRGGYADTVRMLCAEAHPPYDRPPLSKAVLHDAQAEEGLRFRGPDWYADQGIELLLGTRAVNLDVDRRQVTVNDGRRLSYGQLLVATGSRARDLPLLHGLSNVSTLRTLEDARTLRDVLASRKRVAIIGAGFIGQEVAAAAAHAGSEVTLIEAARVPLGALLGSRIGAWFTRLHRSHGVRVISDAQLAAVCGDERADTLVLQDGRRVSCDHVVVGIGVRADLAWLAGSGLDPAGVRVNADGRAQAPSVFAAGDAACTYDEHTGRYLNGGHWESAARQGARAAKAMLGQEQAPPLVDGFWSDLYGTRVQYVGRASSADQATVDGDLDRSDFSVTFERHGRPRAVLLVGRPHQLPAARALLAQ